MPGICGCGWLSRGCSTPRNSRRRFASVGSRCRTRRVWRLVTGTPERLNLRVLVALVRHPGMQPERTDRACGAERRASPPTWPGGRRRCGAQAGTGQEAWPRSLIVTAFAAVGCAVRRGRSRSALAAISLTSAPAAGPPTRAVGGAARCAASPAGSRDGRLTAGRCAFAAMTAAHRPIAARIAGRCESCASAAAAAGRACAPGATGTAVRPGAATGADGSARSSPARRSRIHVTCASRALRRLVLGAVGSVARSSRSLARHAMGSLTSARPALTDCCRWRSARNVAQRKPCLFPDGASPVCRRCRELTYYARHPCALCGEHRRAAWRSPIGAVCGRCMSRHLASRAVCESCGELRRSATFDPARVLSADCAGVKPHRVCELCGGEDERVPDGICTRCRLRLRIEVMADDGAPDAVARMRPYLDALIASPQPRSALLWLAGEPRG